MLRTAFKNELKRIGQINRLKEGNPKILRYQLYVLICCLKNYFVCTTITHILAPVILLSTPGTFSKSLDHSESLHLVGNFNYNPLQITYETEGKETNGPRYKCATCEEKGQKIIRLVEMWMGLTPNDHSHMNNSLSQLSSCACINE